MHARDFFSRDLRRYFLPADIMISYSYGTIGAGIAFFQGRRSSTKPTPSSWSHGAFLIPLLPEKPSTIGITEATPPRSRVFPLRKYADWKHRIIVARVPHWTPEDRVRIVAESSKLLGRRYSFFGIFRAFVDNMIERISWSEKKQSGFRPLARLGFDPFGDKFLFCTEFLGRSIAAVTGEEIYPGDPGQARPFDVWRWLIEKDAEKILEIDRGLVLYPDSHPAGVPLDAAGVPLP